MYEDLRKIIAMFLSPRQNGFPVIIALIGAYCIYLGYDLFKSGVMEGGAALSISWGSSKSFEMGKGGPGLIFSAFGMGLIVFSVSQFSRLRVQPDPKVGIDSDGKSYEVDENGKKIYNDNA